MNYPVWQLTFFGGGLTIAMMAVFHVFISHFAIGGGLFLVLTEWHGYRQNSTAIIDYVKKHTRFFLLVTMVLGGMTGVGPPPVGLDNRERVFSRANDLN